MIDATNIVGKKVVLNRKWYRRPEEQLDFATVEDVLDYLEPNQPYMVTEAYTNVHTTQGKLEGIQYGWFDLSMFDLYEPKDEEWFYKFVHEDIPSALFHVSSGDASGFNGVALDTWVLLDLLHKNPEALGYQSLSWFEERFLIK